MSRYYLIFLASLLVFSSCEQQKTQEVSVKNGVLDISDLNFDNHNNISLSGEWEFYWKKLYNPQDFVKKNINPQFFFPVPGYWNDNSIDTIQLEGQSYATYRLKIISDTTRSLGIFLDEQMTAYNFWCNDSLIFSCGTVASRKEDAVPKRYPIIKEIQILKDTTELIFQISNYHHKRGGFYTTPQVGEIKSLRAQRNKNVAVDIFLIGSLVIMGLYHIGISIYRKGMYAALTFGLFSLILALRTILTSSRFFCILFPYVSWSFQVRLEYFTAYAASTLLIVYLWLLYKADINKKITYAGIAINIILACSIFFSSIFYSSVLPFFFLNMIVLIIYYSYRMIFIVKRKRRGAAIMVVSFVIFSVTVIADILLVTGGKSGGTDLVPIGTFLLMLGQSLVFAQVFSQLFNDNKLLKNKLNKKNIELEHIVDEQTKELEQQKDSILLQNDELEKQNDEIKEKNDELVKQKQLLTKSEAKIRSLVQLLPESICEIDKKGNIMLGNNEFYASTGYTKDEKVNINDIFIKKSENDSLFIDCMAENMKESNIIKELRVDIKRKQNSVFPALLSASLVEGDETIAYRFAFIEITNRILDQETIRNAYQEIEIKNKEITDSLHYASTIQRAVMPSPESMSDSFPNSFVINKPHSIVSGDFYFLKKKDNKIVFALSDCTGHGVPGGFMTMLGITLLNQIYADDELVSPEVALDIIRKKIITSLHQSKDDHKLGNQDGMDMILCILDTETLMLEFASAKQPLFISRNCKINKLKGDRMPVGIYSVMKKYTLQRIQLQKGDILYYHSDGIVDIFGEKNGKKLLSKGLQKIIYSCCNEELETQGKIIGEELSEWQGNNNPIDDMLMIGIKV